MTEFRTVDEVFDGLDALSFEEQVKRFIRIMHPPDTPLSMALTADPRFAVWVLANVEDMCATGRSGLLGRWKNDLCRERGELPDYWEGDDAA